jgi:uncharacterized protein YndB with AHSA1/START domain
MKTLEFSTTINQTAEKVWFTLWDDVNYKNWTAVFHEGSYAVSDWKEGSKVHFLGPSGGGMYAVIEKAIPNVQMSFKHLGVVKDFEEQPLDDESKQWTGAKEEYFLEENNGITTLKVLLQSTDNFLSYFEDIFPKALQKLKELAEKPSITIATEINATIEKVWTNWNEVEHIKQWCAASDDWHVPNAVNNLVVGGTFTTTMAAKDNSMSFDFAGIYTSFEPFKQIHYTMGDGRCVWINFESKNQKTTLTETFEPENMHPFEFQKAGWQSILNNFKKYTENN